MTPVVSMISVTPVLLGLGLLIALLGVVIGTWLANYGIHVAETSPHAGWLVAVLGWLLMVVGTALATAYAIEMGRRLA